jgi:Family of unknown function (DUF6283)
MSTSDPAVGLRARPCGSCPYRRDAPSGLWSADEYAKLPKYDGDIPAQVRAGATGLFMCHLDDGSLCSGWVGCHDMGNNLAVRLRADELDIDAVCDYVSPVPLFGSGAEAAEHGLRDVADPGAVARRAAEGLMRLRNRRVSGE